MELDELRTRLNGLERDVAALETDERPKAVTKAIKALAENQKMIVDALEECDDKGKA